MQKFGIDVSRWQGNFNFAQAKAEGIEFAIIKAGGADCGLYTDKCYQNYYNTCKSLNIPVGAYFFGNEMSLEEAETSANYFVSLLKGKQFEYPVYYDVEAKMLSLDNNLLNQIINKFCSIVQSAGYFVGIYASASPFKTKINDSHFTHWVASYGKSKPSGINYTDIWQFGGGNVNYIRDNNVAGQPCDQDYCYRDFPSEIKSKGLNGFTPSANYLMTAEEYVNKLIHIVNEVTAYNNHYPYNLGYWDGAKFSFDCWNLIKAVINGWYDNRTVGYYQKDLSITGDIDGLHILNKCTYQSKDFSQIKYEGTYLFMRNTHAGTYVGDNKVIIDGVERICNVIECTSAWSHNVLWSYVDENGNRCRYKGASPMSSKWTDWGLMCWVDYSNAPIPEPQPVEAPIVSRPKVTQNPSATEGMLLQMDLNYLGYTDDNGNVLAVDGAIGPCSVQALKKFQKANNINASGIYDVDTYETMKKLI